jgi:hypothetical protein
MERFDIINILIQRFNYKKYLEIGVFNRNLCFNKINCEYKRCVDPIPKTLPDYDLTSDEFFEMNKENWDLIFIDGLHHEEQVFRDITNALKCVNSNGTIICHDLIPANESEQTLPIHGISWTGDCWKAWMKYRVQFDNLEMYVIDTDHGVGIIKEGKQEKIIINQDLNWDFFLNNKHLMNIISTEQFLENLK